ncbi:MAG: hypothetical protein FWC68_01525 [Oscillospiraceae bacterium]|nr:hypothetical protein [Oscillospiraceae bacterium]
MEDFKEDEKQIYELTGLSVKSIRVLKELATKNKHKKYFARQLDAINCLIENEPNYFIFGNVARFLWHDYKGVVQVLEKNSGRTIPFSASKLNNTVMFEIEKYLSKLKEDITES